MHSVVSASSPFIITLRHIFTEDATPISAECAVSFMPRGVPTAISASRWGAAEQHGCGDAFRRHTRHYGGLHVAPTRLLDDQCRRLLGGGGDRVHIHHQWRPVEPSGQRPGRSQG